MVGWKPSVQQFPGPVQLRQVSGSLWGLWIAWPQSLGLSRLVGDNAVERRCHLLAGSWIPAPLASGPSDGVCLPASLSGCAEALGPPGRMGPDCCMADDVVFISASSEPCSLSPQCTLLP